MSAEASRQRRRAEDAERALSNLQREMEAWREGSIVNPMVQKYETMVAELRNTERQLRSAITGMKLERDTALVKGQDAINSNLRLEAELKQVREHCEIYQKDYARAEKLKVELAESKAQTLRIREESDMTSIMAADLVRKHTHAVDGLCKRVLDAEAMVKDLQEKLEVAKQISLVDRSDASCKAYDDIRHYLRGVGPQDDRTAGIIDEFCTRKILEIGGTFDEQRKYAGLKP